MLSEFVWSDPQFVFTRCTLSSFFLIIIIYLCNEINMYNLEPTMKGIGHELDQWHFLPLGSDATDAHTDITSDILLSHETTLSNNAWHFPLSLFVVVPYNTIMIQPIATPWIF